MLFSLCAIFCTTSLTFLFISFCEKFSNSSFTLAKNLVPYAPSIISMTVPKDKIRDVIGKGGATIRSITEVTGAQVDINDDGIVTIASVDQESGLKAKEKIELLTADVEVDRIYEGRVAKIMDFGAFVTILPGKDGLVHISEISEERVESVTDVLSEGQVIQVKVIEVDRQNRIRLSMKAIKD